MHVLFMYIHALFMACSCAAEADEFDGSRAGRHFAVPVGHGAGKPYPLGPTLVHTTRANNPADARCTVNFAVSRTRVPLAPVGAN